MEAASHLRSAAPSCATRSRLNSAPGVASRSSSLNRGGTAATDAQTTARVRAAQANLEQATSALGKAGAQNAAVRAAAAKLAQASWTRAYARHRACEF